MDPYLQPLRIPRPRDRNRDPRDPREPYTREYTLPTIPEPFPSTGSLNFRQGVYNERSMTVEEQNFESFVNNRQAEHDISSYLNEWERLKALEEEAIQLWQELDGNLVEYQRQMRTRDQQAMEYQCQRKKEKTEKLSRPSVGFLVSVREYISLVVRHTALMKDMKRGAIKFAARRASKEAKERRACQDAEKRKSFTEDVQQRAIESALSGVYKAAVKRSTTESAARPTFMKAGDRGAPEAAICKTFVETVKRNLAELEARKRMESEAATNAQTTPSEVASATDGIPSDLGSHLEPSGESSPSPVPQQIRSTDSVSRDSENPSLPPEQPIDNTIRSPRTFVRQSPTLTQSGQTSSNSPSPPRSTSVDDSTPPSSQPPSRSESLRSSPPKRPTASRFVPDPAIWGTSIQAPSSNHPSHSESLRSSPPKRPTASRFVPDLATWGTSIQAPSSTHPSQSPHHQRLAEISADKRRRSRTQYGPFQSVLISNNDSFVDIIITGPPGAGSGRGA